MKDKLKELEQRQREIADEIAELRGQEEKPLTWEDLPVGASFAMTGSNRGERPVRVKISNSLYVTLSKRRAEVWDFPWQLKFIRVDIDGSTYTGGEREE